MAQAVDIACPRCGYDLSGAHAAAGRGGEQAAEGVCSECGLKFVWAEVESARLHPPRFSYEHGGLFDIVRFVRTAGRSITGWMLWTRLRMEHPVRPGRLVIFALGALLATHLLTGAMAVMALRFFWLGGWLPVRAYQNQNWAVTSAPETGQSWMDGAVFTAAGAYQVTWEDVLVLVSWPYNTQPGAWLGGFRFGIDLNAQAIAACLCAQLGTPLLLLGLRQTRRRFRLRPEHVLRGVCLGVPFFLISYVIVQCAIGSAMLVFQLDPWSIRGRERLGLTGAGAFLLAQTLWWWSFARLYLRAPHALGISVAGAVLGGLVCVLGALLLDLQVLYQFLA